MSSTQFARLTHPETITAHLGEAVLPPSQRCPDVPDEEEARASRDKESAHRPESAVALSACACSDDWTQKHATDWRNEYDR